MIRSTNDTKDVFLSVCVWWYRFYLIIGLIVGVLFFIGSFVVRKTTYTKTMATVASDSIYKNENDYETVIVYVENGTSDGTQAPGETHTQTINLPTRRYKDETIPVWYNTQAPGQVSTIDPSNSGTIFLIISIVIIGGASLMLWLSSKFPEAFCALGVFNTISSRF